MPRCTRAILYGQSNGHRGDEIDIAYVDEQFPAVVGELTEAKVRVTVRVCWVEDRRFHETRSRIDEELQRLADGEPDATTSDTWDSGRHGIPWNTQWDGDILCQRLPSQRRG